MVGSFRGLLEGRFYSWVDWKEINKLKSLEGHSFQPISRRGMSSSGRMISETIWWSWSTPMFASLSVPLLPSLNMYMLFYQNDLRGMLGWFVRDQRNSSTLTPIMQLRMSDRLDFFFYKLVLFCTWAQRRHYIHIPPPSVNSASLCLISCEYSSYNFQMMRYYQIRTSKKTPRGWLRGFDLGH